MYIKTISKKEWNKLNKYSKYIGMDKKFYLVKYDDLKGTYLKQVKVK